jgi:hypothetical protein
MNYALYILILQHSKWRRFICTHFIVYCFSFVYCVSVFFVSIHVHVLRRMIFERRLAMGKSCKLDLKTCAATMIIAHRLTGRFLDNATIKKMEAQGGEACLQTLISYPLSEKVNKESAFLFFVSVCKRECE